MIFSCCNQRNNTKLHNGSSSGTNELSSINSSTAWNAFNSPEASAPALIGRNYTAASSLNYAFLSSPEVRRSASPFYLSGFLGST